MRKAVFQRVLFSLAVLVWSGVLLYFYGSGRIVAYLAPDFRLLALAGGLGMAVVGLLTLLTAWQEQGHGHGHDHCGCGHACGYGHEPRDEQEGGGCGHDHETREIHPVLAVALMAAPVLLATAWTEDRFSAGALSRKGLYDPPSALGASLLPKPPPLSREALMRDHPKTGEGYHPFSLIELYFATGDRDMQAVLEGVEVETEGRLAAEAGGNPQATRKRLYRLFLTCCIADSRAIPIVLEYGAPPPEIADDEWVKVRGVVRFLEEKDGVQAVVFVDHTRPAPPPPEEGFFRKG